MFSQVIEEGEKLVIRPISPRLAVERRDPVENPLLQLEVSVQVDLRGLDRLMPDGKLVRNLGTPKRTFTTGASGSTFQIAGLELNRSVKSTGRRSRSRDAVRLSGNFGGQFHSERLYYLEYSAETGIAVCGESFV